MTHRIAAALVAFATVVIALVPGLESRPAHPDETQYVWSGAYFTAKLASLDLRQSCADPIVDPHWCPTSFWSLTQPMGARTVYGVVTGALELPVPRLPYFFYVPELTGPSTQVPAHTLHAARLAAVLCTAAAFALVSLRWGWPCLLLLTILAVPHARDDLPRAWAEGPLLLGLAIAAVSYGTRWFPIACAVAATFKLTAVGLWPIVFLKHPIGRTRFARSLGLLLTVMTWSLLTPASWFAGGPAYVFLMAVNRAGEHAGQSATYGGPLGLFLPSRYVLPLEILALGALIVVAMRWAGAVQLRHRRPQLSPA